MDRDAIGLSRELGARELAVADAIRNRLLRHRVHGDGSESVRSRAFWHGAAELLASSSGRLDLRRPSSIQARARVATHLAADAAAQMVDLDGRVRVERRHVRQLRGGAGNRYDHSRRRLCAGLSATTGRIALRYS